jgi:hypothetical protein
VTDLDSDAFGTGLDVCGPTDLPMNWECPAQQCMGDCVACISILGGLASEEKPVDPLGVPLGSRR